MSNIRRKLNPLLTLVLSLLLLGTVTAFAAGSCSLRVIVQNDDGDPVQYVNVELHQVARKDGSGYQLMPEFAGLDLSAGTLSDEPTAEHAERVYQYAYAEGLSGTIKTTSADGIVDFSALEQGIYLVSERGDQHIAFQPYLAVLPAEIDGNLESNVISYPKTSESDTKTLMVLKLWEDDSNAVGKRPSQIEVTVLRDGIPFRSVVLSESNDWMHQFHMLPASGTYTVEEKPVADYQAEYEPVAEGYIIVNTYTGGSGGGGGEDPKPQTAHVTVRKVWNDHNNAAGKRPASITVQLVSGGMVIKTAALSEANHWSHTFGGLDPDRSYTAQEIAVAGYTASYAGTAAAGITITNTYGGGSEPGTPPKPDIPDPGTINIPVRVEWIDDDDAAGKRPDSVTVYLISNGSILASVELHPGNDWKSVFVGFPADLSYTVWQPPVSEYTTEYSGNAAVGFVVTNIYTEGTTDPGIPPEPTPPFDPELPPEPPAPSDPEEPADPPSEPVVPVIPQTGAEVLPVYLLMAAGVLLVLLGIIDLYRGRKEV